MTTFLLIALGLSITFVIVTASLLHRKPRTYEWKTLDAVDPFDNYDVIKEAKEVIRES